MIRKALILVFMCVILTSITAFAGDIPESLMLGNQQALFIGKLTDKNSEIYTITPLTIMMGSITQKEVKVNKFEKYYGTSDIPEKGDILVAVLLEEGKIDDLWVFKATTENYKTLNLKSEKYDIVKRYEKYINEGKYFEAQKKINEKAMEQIDKTKMDIKSESNKVNSVQDSKSQTIDNIQKNKYSLSIVLLVIGLLVAVSASYKLVIKKQK